MQEFKVLYEFIDRAVKSRNYPENTANGLKSALRLFEEELEEEEKGSLEKVKSNINQIYRDVYNKHGDRFSSASLETYKSRILKVLGDYEKYGKDPVKMSSWPRRVVVRNKRDQQLKNHPNELATPAEKILPGSTPDTHKIDLALRPDAKAIIIVPRDMSKEECARIKGLLDSLAM